MGYVVGWEASFWYFLGRRRGFIVWFRGSFGIILVIGKLVFGRLWLLFKS